MREEAITNPVEIANKKKRLRHNTDKSSDEEMKDENFLELNADQVGLVKTLEDE